MRSKKTERDFYENKNFVIPEWDAGYIYSSVNPNYLNKKVKNFYEYFREQFFKGEYVEINKNWSYLFNLFYELIETSRDETELLLTLNKLAVQYPKILNYVKRLYFYRDIKGYEEGTTRLAEKLLSLESKYIFNEETIKLRKQLGSTQCSLELFLSELFTEKPLLKIRGGSYLNRVTEYGLKNKNYLFERIDNFFEQYYLENKKFFLSEFYLGITKENVKNIDIENLKSKFSDKEKLEEIINWENQYFEINSRNNPFCIRGYHLAERKFEFTVSEMMRGFENDLRSENNLPKIGEGWISETELFYKIKTEFKNLNVLQHYKPKWLGRQHFDVFIQEYNIAIEYQGKQHYEPVEFFGGEKAFLKNQERDVRKRNLCIENKCKLIYVDEGESWETVRDKIEINFS